MSKRNLETRLQLITDRLEAIEKALGEGITHEGRKNVPEERTKEEEERKIHGGERASSRSRRC